MKTKEATEKKERPIIFGADSIKAILEGRKTQTRRIIKLPKDIVGTLDDEPFESAKYCLCSTKSELGKRIYCPYGKVGDLLWVREKWSYRGGVCKADDTYFNFVGYADGTKRDVEFTDFDEMMDAAPQQRLKYPPDYDELWEHEQVEVKNELIRKWWDRQKNKSARYMPRWASRITLEITNIRVERLQDISEDEAKKEGVEIGHLPPDEIYEYSVFGSMSYKQIFKLLWDKINGAESWKRNEFVWVIEFKKL